MQLELHFADVCAHVLVVERLDVDRPLVGVAVALPLLSEVATDAPVDDGLHHAHALHPLALAAAGPGEGRVVVGHRKSKFQIGGESI